MDKFLQEDERPGSDENLPGNFFKETQTHLKNYEEKLPSKLFIVINEFIFCAYLG